MPVNTAREARLAHNAQWSAIAATIAGKLAFADSQGIRFDAITGENGYADILRMLASATGEDGLIETAEIIEEEAREADPDYQEQLDNIARTGNAYGISAWEHVL